eukprot:gene17231-17421_t
MIPVGLGHVGWGFQAGPDQYYYGGLETAGIYIPPGRNNSTNNCLGSFAEMIKNMKTTDRPGEKQGGYPYHEYKTKVISNPNIKAALAKVADIRAGGYNLHGFNCCDAVFNVIKAYDNGNDRTLPWPSTHWAPRWWYAAIPGRTNLLQSQWPVTHARQRPLRNEAFWLRLRAVDTGLVRKGSLAVLSFNRLGDLGRLGNQMFQYAGLAGIAARHGYEFCIPPSDARDLWKDHQLLQAFDLSLVAALRRQDGAPELRERSFAFDADLFETCADHSDISGFLQSPRYFAHIDAAIRREFRFKAEFRQACERFVGDIGVDLISVHVRRGDYVKLKHQHPPCSLDYYRRAIAAMPKGHAFVVFSDDIAWCKRQSVFQGSGFLFIEGQSNIMDLCLMRHCRHHVIANSSFSCGSGRMAIPRRTAPRI